MAVIGTRLPTQAGIVWPAAHDYVEAIQNPQVCFADGVLREGSAALDRLGMPFVAAGNCAYVFKLKRPIWDRAVRCFRGFLGDREDRYTAIDQHLDNNRIPYVVSFEYDSEGMLVFGRRYPILVMEWISGPTLDVFVGEVIGKKDVLIYLADEWCRVVKALEEAKVAHGDLQHGNIIVHSGQLRLVDLDGMFVPALAGGRAPEIGHPAYQHPQRTAEHFDLSLDNFSALVIYLSLRALAEAPDLWKQFHDENLIFARQDFLDPTRSRLFTRVKGLGGDVAHLAEVLAKSCVEAARSTPRVTELVSVKTSRLPGWMRPVPSGIAVETKTREVSKGQVQPTGVVVAKVSPVPYTSPSPWSHQPVPSAPVSLPTTVTSQPQPSAAEWIRTIAAKTLTVLIFPGLLVLWLWAILLPAFGVTSRNPNFYSYLWLLYALSCIFIGVFLARKEIENRTKVSQTSQRSTATTYPTSASRPTAHVPSHPPFKRYPSGGHQGVVVGSSIRFIYHRPHCKWAGKISGRNRRTFNSPGDAQGKGYRPCNVCSP